MGDNLPEDEFVNNCKFCEQPILCIPYKCRLCGDVFCAKHRLPEMHKCKNITCCIKNNNKKSTLPNEHYQKYFFCDGCTNWNPEKVHKLCITCTPDNSNLIYKKHDSKISFG